MFGFNLRISFNEHTNMSAVYNFWLLITISSLLLSLLKYLAMYELLGFRNNIIKSGIDTTKENGA